MNADLAWGLQMTVLGMGLVFALLALLWGLLVLVQRMDKQPAEASASASLAATDAAAEPDEAEPPPATDSGPLVTLVQGMDAELVAAIMVATLAHKAISRREAAPAMRSYWPGSLLYASRWVGTGRARQNNSWQRKGR